VVTPKISLIVCVRLVKGVYEGAQRLSLIVETVPASVYDIVIVDYGSPAEGASQIAQIAEGHPHATIVRVEKESAPFSIGEARDIGVQHAKNDIVMFNDIDFFGPAEMYQRIAAEVSARRMRENIYDFFCVPIVSLTDIGTEKFYEQLAEFDPGQIIHEWHSIVIEHKIALFSGIVYGSSAIVSHRHNYLSIGGHNRQFTGHGAEDYDVLHRLAYTCQKSPRTNEYYRDTKSNNVREYVGFRAFFALYGIDVFQRGLFLVHLFHPKRQMPNYFQSRRNFELLAEVMVQFDKHKYQPVPLNNIWHENKTLLIVDPLSRADEVYRYATPLMGQVYRVSEKLLSSPASLLAYIEKEGFNRVGFLNPYGSSTRKALYDAVRASGVAYWVFDRGALPESWFFDPEGFNADSTTYDQSRWDTTLTETEYEAVKAYIRDLKASGDTLEANGAIRGADYWRQTFDIGQRKVLFVPLQRPNDTVIKHFADPVGDMDTFLSWVESVAAGLDPVEWAVVIKKHPLELKNPSISNVYFAPDTAHIHDLIDLSDRLLLINSGTGVVAMALERPVIYCGTPFYKIDGVNYSASSAEEVIALCQSKLGFNKTAAAQFLHHLTTRVYSFGQTDYDEAKDHTGAPVRLAKSIKFRSIRGLGDPVHLGVPRSGISLDAPLFTSFGGREGITKASTVKGSGAPSKVAAPMRIVATPPAGLRDLPTSLRIGELLIQAGVNETGFMVSRFWAEDRFPLRLLKNAKWLPGTSLLFNAQNWPVVLGVATGSPPLPDLEVTLLLHHADPAMRQLEANGAVLDRVDISANLSLVSVAVGRSQEVVLTGQSRDVQLELITVTKAQASNVDGEDFQLRAEIAGPSHSIRVAILNPGVVLSSAGYPLAIAFENDSKQCRLLNSERHRLQIRFKGADRRTITSFSTPIMHLAAPGVSVAFVSPQIPVHKIAPLDPEYVMIAVIGKNGEELWIGRDQRMQILNDAALPNMTTE
jgi:predicted glycosyltransferase involved in capsule biosynthesis